MSRVSTSKANVLVVDLDRDLYHFIKSVLGPNGYGVSFTHSSASAIPFIQKKAIDLLMANVDVSQLGGVKLLREAHNIRPSIGLIATCSTHSKNLALASFQAGAQAVLVKPYDAEKLKKVVEEVSHKSQLLKEDMRCTALRGLFQLNKSLASQFNAQRIFNNIVQLARIETRAQSVCLMLLDEISSELVVKASIGMPRSIQKEDSELLKICRSTIKSGRPVLLNAHPIRTVGKAGVTSILCAPILIDDRVVGVINCTKTWSPIPFIRGDLELLSILAVQAAAAVKNSILFDNMKSSKISDDAFLTKALNAQEEERKRVSAELHDGLAQWLVSALYCAQLSDTFIKISRFDEAQDEIRRVQSIIDRSIKELRRIIMDLHPSELAEIGLVGVVQRGLRFIQREQGICSRLRIVGHPIQLSLRQEVTVYRIVAEALSNIWKHSHASNVEVVFNYMPEGMNVEITDDGCGFNLDEALASEFAEGSIGLVSMKERALMVNGNLEINTSPGKGTKVILTMPVLNYSVN